MPRPGRWIGWDGAALAIAVLALVVSGVAPAVAAEAPPAFTPLPALDTGIEELNSAAFSPDGRLLAVVCNCTPPLTVYAVGADGGLATVTERSFGSYPDATAAAFSPDGHLLAVGEPGVSGSTVYMYAVAPSGTLTSLGSALSGAGLSSLAFSPDGRLLVTADEYGDTVSTFTVGADGSLTAQGTVATGSSPLSLAFSPDGHLLAVADWGGSSVSMFSVGEDGALTSAGTTAVTEFPRSLTFSPDGRLLAVSDERGTPVSMFTVGAGGALTPTAGPTTSPEPHTIAFSPDGHLFAVAEYSTVSLFTVPGFTPIGEPLPTDAEWADWVGFSPPGGMLAVTSSNRTSGWRGTISLFSYPIAPPTATISSPGDGRTFAVGEAVPTSFSCADSEYGLGIASCTDSDGATEGSGSLDTSKVGTFTYTVTAASRDGHAGTTSITYTVTGATPPSSGSTPSGSPSPRGCNVPKLKGRKLKAARKKIRAADCELGKVTRKKGVSAKTARVVRQRPKPGTVHGGGSRVSVRLG